MAGTAVRVRHSTHRLLVRFVPFLILLALCLLGGPALAATPTLAATDHDINWGAAETHFPKNKQNESPMATNPTNAQNSITGANDEVEEPDCTLDSSGGSQCPFSPTVNDSGAYTTKDGGATWQLQILHWESAGITSQGDPAVAFGPKPDGHGGFTYTSGARAYFGSLAFPVGNNNTGALTAVSRSDDGGTTWSAPVVTTTRTNTRSQFNDKDAIWADNNPSSPYFGYVYNAWTLFKNAGAEQLPPNHSPDTIVIARSTDGGQTWDNPVSLSPSANNNSVGGRQGSIVRTDREGRVFVVWEDTINKQSVMVAAISTDGGKHFSKRITIGPVQDLPSPLPGSSFRNDSFPGMDVDQSSDAIYVCWTDYQRTSTDGHGVLTVKKSLDHGETWTSAGTINIASRTPFFPGLAVARNGAAPPASATPGRVVVGFTALTDVPNSTPPVGGSVNYLPFLAGSNDGGTTWSVPTTPAGALASDPAASSTNSLTAQFLGDYNAMSAAPDGTTFLFSYTSAQTGTTCAAVDTFRTGAGPRPNIYTACAPTFGNTNIHVAVIATS